MKPMTLYLLKRIANIAQRVPGTFFRTWGRRMHADISQVDNPQGSWRRFLDGLDTRLLEYDPSLVMEAKKGLFKKAVWMAEFEPHAFCNRQCTFCPNVFGDRIHNWTAMDFEIYRKAISDLASIDYDRTVRFARYCEPLASKAICDYVSVARQLLPKAHIDIVSNGDYLDDDLLEQLVEAGLSALRISIYPKGKGWSMLEAEKQLGLVLKRINGRAELLIAEADYGSWRIAHQKIDIFAEASDLTNRGFDRGQSVIPLMDAGYCRKAPCTMMFTNVTIDFNLAVMPCCNLRSDLEEHKNHVIDFLSLENNLFDIYFSKSATAWRRSLASVGLKAPPCNTCKQKRLDDPVALHHLQDMLHEKLKSNLVPEQGRRT